MATHCRVHLENPRDGGAWWAVIYGVAESRTRLKRLSSSSSRTLAYQAPQSMGFSRQVYWNGLTFPSPGDLPNPGIKPRSPALQADALQSEPPGKPLKKVKVAQSCLTLCEPMDYTVHGTLQARILEWVVLSFSRGSSQHRYRTQVSHIAGRFFTS